MLPDRVLHLRRRRRGRPQGGAQPRRRARERPRAAQQPRGRLPPPHRPQPRRLTARVPPMGDLGGLRHEIGASAAQISVWGACRPVRVGGDVDACGRARVGEQLGAVPPHVARRRRRQPAAAAALPARHGHRRRRPRRRQRERRHDARRHELPRLPRPGADRHDGDDDVARPRRCGRCSPGSSGRTSSSP